MSHHVLRRIISSFLLAAGLATSGLASASGFSSMYVFGDSLSDSGNVYAASGSTSPSAPYWLGRYSNGPTYAEDLAKLLDVSLTPSLTGGTNYAFAGATAAAGSKIGSLATDLGTQVDAFRALSGKADPNALYVVWAGGNDLLANPTAAGIGAAIGGVSGAIQGLHTEGARNFLVMNLPNMGLSPEVNKNSALAAVATAGSLAFDNYFASTVTYLRGGLVGSNIRTLDTFALLTASAENAGAYGLSNTSDACVSGGVVCSNPGSYLFWDSVHPTAAGHALIADAAYKVLAVPEPDAYALLLAGLGLMVSIAHRRKLREL